MVHLFSLSITISRPTSFWLYEGWINGTYHWGRRTMFYFEEYAGLNGMKAKEMVFCSRAFWTVYCSSLSLYFYWFMSYMPYLYDMDNLKVKIAEVLGGIERKNMLYSKLIINKWSNILHGVSSYYLHQKLPMEIILAKIRRWKDLCDCISWFWTLKIIHKNSSWMLMKTRLESLEPN